MLEEDREVIRLFVRKKPEACRTQASISPFDGGVAMYSANYEASQEQLKEDFEKQEKSIKAELRKKKKR